MAETQAAKRKKIDNDEFQAIFHSSKYASAIAFGASFVHMSGKTVNPFPAVKEIDLINEIVILKNPSKESPIYFNGYTLSDIVKTHVFHFPDDFVLQPHAEVMVDCIPGKRTDAESDIVHPYRSAENKYLPWMNKDGSLRKMPVLNNEGETICIHGKEGNIVSKFKAVAVEGTGGKECTIEQMALTEVDADKADSKIPASLSEKFANLPPLPPIVRYIDLHDEVVIVRNVSPADTTPLDLTGYTLTDGETKNVYHFPENFTLPAQAEVIVDCMPGKRPGHGKASTEGSSDLAVGGQAYLPWLNKDGSLRSKEVLNNTGDTIFLNNAEGRVLSAYTALAHEVEVDGKEEEKN